MTAPAHEKSAGVSSIELFFDLVFVFVITQVTQLRGGPSPARLRPVYAGFPEPSPPGSKRSEAGVSTMILQAVVADPVAEGVDEVPVVGAVNRPICRRRR